MPVNDADKTLYKNHASNTIGLPVRESFIHQVNASHTINIALCEKIEANLVGGNLVFLPGKQPDVAEIRMQWDTDPKLLPKIFIKDNTLHIKSLALKPFFKQTSQFVIEVTLPPYIDISAQLMVGGTVYIDRFTSNLNVFVRAGEVKGVTCAKKVNVEVQAGDIHLLGLTGDATVKNKLGDVKVGFDVINSRSKIELSTFLGDVELFVPREFMPIEGRKTMKKNSYIENPAKAQICTKIKLGDVRISNNNNVARLD